MKRFYIDPDVFFNKLDMLLNDGMCHVYKDVVLPEKCQPQITRIGFEKYDNAYKVYIDNGITTTSDNETFTSFLRAGEVEFMSLNELKNFFAELSTLFRVQDQTANESIYDKNRVHKIIEDDEPKKIWPEDISRPLKEKVKGQDMAIDKIALNIATKFFSKDDKLLTMMLLGKTGVGKTETGKNLSDILSSITGKKYGFIKIDGGEFEEEFSVSRFFGAPPGYVGYGADTVLENVKNNAYHVIMFDEIEKAHNKIITGIMEALDTGYLSMADNSDPINLNKSIFIFTSNIPIKMEVYRELSNFEQTEMCRNAFTKHCNRPEISARINDYIVYTELSPDARIEIIAKIINEELANYEIELVKIDESLLAGFLKFSSKYGVRALRSYIQTLISTKLLKNHYIEQIHNKKIHLKGSTEELIFDVCTKG